MSQRSVPSLAVRYWVWLWAILALVFCAGCDRAAPTATPTPHFTLVAVATRTYTPTFQAITRTPVWTPTPQPPSTEAPPTPYPPPATALPATPYPPPPTATEDVPYPLPAEPTDTPLPTPSATMTMAPTLTPLVTAPSVTAPPTLALPATATPFTPPGQPASAQEKPWPTAVPILYEMQDYENRDWRREYPEWGPLGSWMWWTWAQIQPEPGRYNWAIIDNYLARAATQRVELVTGELIPKPVALSILVYPDIGQDATPSWVYDRHIPDALWLGDRRVGWLLDPEGGCATVGIPRWGDPTWERLFDEFVMALGSRYENDPRVNSVWITTSLYGESVEERTQDGCRYVFSRGRSLHNWVLHLMRTYRRAFPTKPLFIINSAGWGIRRDSAALAASMEPPIGIKLNVLAPDLNDSYGYNSLAGGGKFEIVNQYSDTLPIAFEHAFAHRPADTYWSIMNGLAHRATLMDFDYPEMFRTIRGLDPIFPLWDFIDEHLGRNAYTTPDVWILLRETHHPKSKYQGWSSGEYGDWGFFLTRPEAIPGNATVAITNTIRSALPSPAGEHIYGFHSTRRTDEATGNPYMSFRVDSRYPYWGQQPLAAGGQVGYTFQIVILNQGEDTFALQYKDVQGEWVERVFRKGPELGPVNDWVTLDLVLEDAYMAGQLPGGTDLRLDSRGDGDEVVHRLILRGFGKDAAP